MVYERLKKNKKTLKRLRKCLFLALVRNISDKTQDQAKKLVEYISRIIIAIRLYRITITY